VLGAKEVARVLRLYRDQIQFVHDQTIRRMNQGMTPQEIAETVTLPPALNDEHPWGRQYYGTVKHSTRNVYGGYVGWFQGDPVDLDPTPRREQARDYVKLMGGRDRVLNEARRAFKANKHQQAAELATLLLRINTEDDEPRRLKAAAFRKLGYAQMNASWRNYYLVSAMELDRQIPEAIYLREAVKMLGPALRGLPAQNQMAALPTRLRAEETYDKDMIAAIRYTEDGTLFRVHLRHGVLEVSPLRPAGAKFVLNVTRESMGDLLAGVDPATLLGSAITVEGDANLAKEFLSYFDRAFQHRPEVVVR
jgi:alkyl sulfatase BDS1-like metallo-beta-lactamase superfamily hydrolase